MAEAKAKLSRLIDRAGSEGPQTIRMIAPAKTYPVLPVRCCGRTARAEPGRPEGDVKPQWFAV